MIFYALLCRIDGTILAEGFPDEMEGNFPQIAQNLVDFLKEKPVLNLERISDTKDVIQSEDESTITTLHCELYDGARRTFVNSHQDDFGFFCNMTDIFQYGFCNNTTADPEHQMEHSKSNEKYYFHCGREGNLMFICLADDVTGRRHRVYVFLIFFGLFYTFCFCFCTTMLIVMIQCFHLNFIFSIFMFVVILPSWKRYMNYSCPNIAKPKYKKL